ncbi:hypothetical protein G7Y89_g6522 [Cudoniella acicularis]|uniref:Uncharacterized protein n=1 Tax=Cudoniella acicularis TaxID=354080 RepID=A0A8H4RLS1_9HELO|nr:hypothetical protein G7Y89_g6522 [Cudoniella acicularis]
MNLITFLISASCICLCHAFAAAQSSADAFWFLPNAPITKYSATVVVPAVSTGIGFHAVWPGLENTTGGFVYQSVISDSNGVGSWQFWVEYCCNPNYNAPAIKVYPGDSITSTFTLGSNGYWTDAWTVTPGSVGTAAGEKVSSGSTSQNFASSGALTRALLAIETHNGGTWDFGQVQFSNIAISATTTTAWCSTGYAVSPTFNYAISSGTMLTSGGTTTCSYPTVMFYGP